MNSHERVIKGYRNFAKQQKNWIVIDGTKSVQEIS